MSNHLLNSRQFLLTILFCLITTIGFAQNFEWVGAMGSTTTDRAHDVTTDPNGNVITVGGFTGTADFDPGPGIFTLYSSGAYHPFIQKLDGNGNLIWAVNVSFSNGGGETREVATDSLGNIYVIGHFSGTADFDPGSGTQLRTAVGGQDVFVLKLDPNGGFLWVSTVGGSNADNGYAITLDDSNNVYATGSYWNTADFDPGPGTHNLSSNGQKDVFLWKLDESGNFVWVRTYGASGEDQGYGVDIDGAGNILLGGFFMNTVDFDPGPGFFNRTSNGSTDLFLTKLDPAGNMIWARTMGGAEVDLVYEIACDHLGNTYLTGAFDGAVDFDPGAGVFTLYSVSSSRDYFLEKIDANGNFVWVTAMGTSSSNYGEGVSVDDMGNVYTVGDYWNSMDLDPGPASYTIPVSGYSIFIRKLNHNMGLEWAVAYGESAAYIGTRGIHVDENSNVYAVGLVGDTADFDPGPGVALLGTATQYRDAFVQKLSQCATVASTESLTTCDTFTWPANGMTYTSSGTHSTVLTNASGCDSVVTLNLTITQSNSGSETVTACDSYLWPANGMTYTSSGTHSTILTNASGCDSVVTLNLIITTSTSGSETVTACDSYLWPANGMTYTSSGTHSTVLTNAFGCDSTATLILTITSVNSSVTQAGSTLTANATNSTYQWMDCDSGYAAISGATSSTFTPTQSGNYSVAVTENSCTDTSSCFNVIVVGTPEPVLSFQVYPNPTYGTFKVQFNGSPGIYTASLYNSLGQVVGVKEISDLDQFEMEITGSRGYYFLHILSPDHGHTPVKILKQ